MDAKLGGYKPNGIFVISIESIQENQKSLYLRDGILVFDPGIESELIDKVAIETKKMFAAQPTADRFQDAWKEHSTILQLATHPKIINLLQTIYERKPLPFQTLNFQVGTEQAVHSDTIHFNSHPSGYMCGVWFALEDIDLDNGPLVYYPKTHRLPEITLQDIGYEPLGENYGKYEQHLKKFLDESGLPSQFSLIKKGSCVIWAANLLHGGASRKDRSRTRLTQVTHYFFEGSEYYYTPMLSSSENILFRTPEWIPYE